jgi:DNA-binding PadR family transcriptional regulator
MKSLPPADYALLGALMPGPKHGYEILHFLAHALESTWQVSPSQLYVLLKRLEQQGLLRSNLKAQDTRPSKRVFSLTAAGERAFLAWLHSPVLHVRELRIEFFGQAVLLLPSFPGWGGSLDRGAGLRAEKNWR